MVKKLLSVLLVVLMLAMVPLTMLPTSATTADTYKKKIASLQEKEKEYQAQLEKTQDKIKDKKDYSKTLTKQIDVLNKQIKESHAEISKLNQSIAVKQQAIDEAKAKIDQQMEALKKRIRTIYMSGETSDLEIILGAKDFSDLLDKYELVKILSDYDQKLIDEIQVKLDKVAVEKSALVSERTDLQDSKTILDEKQGKLQSLLDENEEILASLYADERDVESMIANTNKQEAEIQSRLNAYYNAQNGGNSGGSGTPVNVTPSGFAWPVPGYYYVISSYGEDRGYSHKGIDITGGGIMGATTVAAYGGTVITSNNSCSHNWGKNGSCGCGGGYGNYVLIDHGNGKSTIYAHLSSTTVSAGQSVSKGQTIGYVGSTGWSTGAHLHYECRINGADYNPMNEY